MPWFKVDDGFHGHPKVVDLSLDAVGLWALTGSWSAKYLTDGFVPDKTVTRLGGTLDQAAELVACNLWSKEDGGFLFRDWDEYQPLKSEVQAERAAAQERMRELRARKKGVRPNERRTNDERSDERNPKFGRSSEEVRSTHPIPSHPDKELVQEEPALDLVSEFADWWQVYPRKQGKADALKAYKVIRKKVAADVLLKGAQTYALLSAGEDRSFLKLPAGWLRGQRWEDEPLARQQQPTRSGTVTPGTCIHDYPTGECPYCAEGQVF